MNRLLMLPGADGGGGDGGARVECRMAAEIRDGGHHPLPKGP